MEPTEIGASYRVRCDGAHNYILERRSVAGERAKNPGEVTWTDPKYYGKLSQLIGSYAEQLIMDSGAELVEAVQESLKGTREAISSLATWEDRR